MHSVLLLVIGRMLYPFNNASTDSSLVRVTIELHALEGYLAPSPLPHPFKAKK